LEGKNHGKKHRQNRNRKGVMGSIIGRGTEQSKAREVQSRGQKWESKKRKCVSIEELLKRTREKRSPDLWQKTKKK